MDYTYPATLSLLGRELTLHPLGELPPNYRMIDAVICEAISSGPLDSMIAARVELVERSPSDIDADDDRGEFMFQLVLDVKPSGADWGEADLFNWLELEISNRLTPERVRKFELRALGQFKKHIHGEVDRLMASALADKAKPASPAERDSVAPDSGSG